MPGPVDEHVLNRIGGEALDALTKALRREGVRRPRVIICIDDIAAMQDGGADTLTGTTLAAAPETGRDVRDEVLDGLRTHFTAMADAHDVPIAVVAGNTLVGDAPLVAVSAEELADVLDRLRALVAFIGYEMALWPGTATEQTGIRLDAGPPEELPEELGLRLAISEVLEAIASITLAPAIVQLLRGAGIHDGSDGSPRPKDWPEHLPWGTD